MENLKIFSIFILLVLCIFLVDAGIIESTNKDAVKENNFIKKFLNWIKPKIIRDSFSNENFPNYSGSTINEDTKEIKEKEVFYNELQNNSLEDGPFYNFSEFPIFIDLQGKSKKDVEEEVNYLRFWLDFPGGAHPSGDYDKTVSCKGCDIICMEQICSGGDQNNCYCSKYGSK